jgi:hypothetical protein
VPLDEPSKNWIISHRGLWKSKVEQNSPQAFRNAAANGFAIETDVRDHQGELVVSHDVVSSFGSINFLEMDGFTKFALNIKEDGLFAHFERVRSKIESSSSFLFDGSIPQMYQVRKVGLPHALRLSEFEKEIPWKSQYLWIDGFDSDWWMNSNWILRKLDEFNCIFVSPELHGREHRAAFDWFAELKKHKGYNFSVCTDYPLELQEISSE